MLLGPDSFTKYLNSITGYDFVQLSGAQKALFIKSSLGLSAKEQIDNLDKNDKDFDFISKNFFNCFAD